MVLKDCFGFGKKPKELFDGSASYRPLHDRGGAARGGGDGHSPSGNAEQLHALQKKVQETVLLQAQLRTAKQEIELLNLKAAAADLKPSPSSQDASLGQGYKPESAVVAQLRLDVGQAKLRAAQAEAACMQQQKQLNEAQATISRLKNAQSSNSGGGGSSKEVEALKQVSMISARMHTRPCHVHAMCMHADTTPPSAA